MGQSRTETLLFDYSASCMSSLTGKHCCIASIINVRSEVFNTQSAAQLLDINSWTIGRRNEFNRLTGEESTMHGSEYPYCLRSLPYKNANVPFSPQVEGAAHSPKIFLELSSSEQHREQGTHFSMIPRLYHLQDPTRTS